MRIGPGTVALLAGALALGCPPARPPGSAAHSELARWPAGHVLVTMSGDRLGLTAVATPWPLVLAELCRHTGVAIQVTPLPGGTVTVSIEDVPFETALRQLFGADAGFVYLYRPAAPGQPPALDELWITSRSSSAPGAARATGGPSREITPARRAHAGDAGGSGPAPPSPHEPATEDAPGPAATLSSEDPDLRQQALDEIVERGDGSGVAEVSQVLGTDREAEVRARAVKALTRIGTPEALEALRQAMSDAEVTVRLGAVDAIATFETPRARTLLREALRDPEEQVRVSAAAALRDLGSRGR